MCRSAAVGSLNSLVFWCLCTRSVGGAPVVDWWRSCSGCSWCRWGGPGCRSLPVQASLSSPFGLGLCLGVAELTVLFFSLLMEPCNFVPW
jgi:hypothetical protein